VGRNDIKGKRKRTGTKEIREKHIGGKGKVVLPSNLGFGGTGGKKKTED